MKQLKQMKEILTGAVQGQLSNLGQADYKELGAAVDMIKDLSEAIYYCTITESMKEAKEKEEMMMKMGGGQQQQQQQQQPQSMMYFHERVKEPYYERDMDRNQGRMYYNGGGGNSGGGSSGSNSGGSGSSGGNSGGGSRGYSEPTYTNQRDSREGRSGERRRTYMESKKMNTDKGMHIRELEEYAHELTNDILEMVQDASPEEKQALKKKILELSNKM